VYLDGIEEWSGEERRGKREELRGERKGEERGKEKSWERAAGSLAVKALWASNQKIAGLNSRPN
jgi:hypothetical protein